MTHKTTPKGKEMATKEQLSRRQFVTAGAVVGGGVALAGSLAGKPAQAMPVEHGTSSGYRMSEHVQTYYALARF